MIRRALWYHLYERIRKRPYLVSCRESEMDEAMREQIILRYKYVGIRLKKEKVKRFGAAQTSGAGAMKPSSIIVFVRFLLLFILASAVS